MINAKRKRKEFNYIGKECGCIQDMTEQEIESMKLQAEECVKVVKKLEKVKKLIDRTKSERKNIKAIESQIEEIIEEEEEVKIDWGV